MPESTRVLIIDDSPHKRETLAEWVSMLDYEVVETENGMLGLAEARRSEPIVILLDIEMPEMNGLEFLDERANDQRLRDIPVIIITGHVSTPDPEGLVAECLRKGAEDVLPMPPDYEILKARLGTSIARRKSQLREAEFRGRLEQSLLNVTKAEKEADRLLRSIFPDDAVRELKESNELAPRRHDDSAVLFCDVVDFTSWCESHEPQEVVARLEELVEVQEEIAGRLGVDKVKTIGDAFMAARNLAEHGDDGLLDCVRCGLEFAAAAREHSANWQVRVGVHTGPVIAGKIGRKSFAYDVWGATVNTAARVQTAASPSTLFVSEPVWSRVSSRCRGVSQGVVELKGVGPMELFRVDEVLD